MFILSVFDTPASVHLAFSEKREMRGVGVLTYENEPKTET
jgi:hypothetical protein